MDRRAQILGGIEDPTKRAILQYLIDNGVSYLGEILKGLSLSYSKGQKYISELKQEGLVETTTEPPKFNVAV